MRRQTEAAGECSGKFNPRNAEAHGARTALSASSNRIAKHADSAVRAPQSFAPDGDCASVFATAATTTLVVVVMVVVSVLVGMSMVMLVITTFALLLALAAALIAALTTALSATLVLVVAATA
jgi:hypothetical protein